MKIRALGRSTLPNADDPIAVGLSVGDGIVVLLTTPATRNRITTPIPSTTPQLLLAANPGRLAATVTNAGGTNLHVDEAAIAGGPSSGERLVAPGQSFDVDENYVLGLFGWWDAPVSGNYVTVELT